LIAVGVIVAGTVALGDIAFADMTPTFRFNATLGVIVPLALLAGMVAAILWAAGVFHRRNGLRFTVREMMVAVALLGMGLGTARWWVQYNFATVYALGYSESQFRRVRIGMTAMEVESILGLPIRKVSNSPLWTLYENWIYSEPPPTGTWGDNYWRRWVMFENGRVAVIVDDYFED
jgi:hypothetical protein